VGADGVGYLYLDVSAAVHHRAGLGRYADSLTRAMVAARPGRFALFYNREQGVEPLQGLTQLPSRTVALGYKPWRMLVWAGQVARVPFDRWLPGVELFHAMEHLLLPLRSVPTVLTVHDLIFQHLPQHHKALNRWYLRLALPLFCRRAGHIIAVSETTRNDLVASYHLPAEKISVVYEAAAPGFQPQPASRVAQVRERYGLPDGYLLHVGTIEPRKNLTRLLRVWERLYTRREAPPLVLVGRRGWLADEFYAALEASPAREGVILTDYVEDGDLPAIYAGATLFVFPSLYEGFGLPPLEAMACGTPVVCSHAPALPEFVGDAAVLVDPLDELALEEGLHQVLTNPDERAQLRARGLLQAACFSWERAAEETLQIYDRLLSA